MLNIEEINEAIKNLENGETSYNACEKLAYLYIVKDHYKGKKKDRNKNDENLSEFIRLAKELKNETLLCVIDDHLERVKIISPNEYDRLMYEIKEKVEE